MKSDHKQAAVEFLQMVLTPGEPGIAVVHLFRFQAGKIVEMWDCGQQLPADSPNTDGAF